MNYTASRAGDALSNLEQRRMPVQDRSRERVELILNEASQLISEVGVQGAKTSEIARRAEISLASLYRYFPNKAAIVKALAEKHMEKLAEVLRKLVDQLDFEEGCDQLIDAYAHFYRSEPGYKEIWSGVEAMPELRELDLGELFDNAHLILEKVKGLYPDLDHEKLWLICVMIPRACSAIMRLAMTMELEQEEIMRNELKLMVRHYLKHRLESPAFA